MNLLASVLIVGLNAHPFHVSVAVADWNAESGKLEVSLRCHPIDLEQVVNERAKKRVHLEKAESQVQAYLIDVIKATTRDGQDVKLEWVGMELTDKYAWLYFEIPLKDGPSGTTLTHRLFFTELDDQVNLVTVRDGKRKRSFSFSADVPKITLRLSDE